MKNISLLFCIFLVLTTLQLSGCGRNKDTRPQTSLVNIKLPVSNRADDNFEEDISNPTEELWGGTAPTTGGDYNCFMVAYDISSGMGPTSCTDDASTQLFRADGGEGWAYSGGTLTLTLPKQNGIRLYLVGAVATSAADCGTLANTDANSANLSNPRLLSTTYVDVTQDVQNVTLTGSHGTSTLIGDCTGNFGWTSTTYSNSCTGHTTDINYNDNGAGTSTYPYMICSIDQFNDIGTSACNNTVTTGCSSYYRLGANLTFSTVFVPIGGTATTYGAFTGTFDGQNYSLSNINLNSMTGDYYGIFRSLENGATVSGLTIINPTINLPSSNKVGVLAGYVATTTSAVAINGVTITGATVTGLADVGGLIGLGSNATLQNISVAGTVTGVNDVGGIASGLNGTSSVIMSKFIGSASSTSTSTGSSVGGIIGYTSATSLTLNKIKSSLTSLSCVGGASAYCRVGGIIGYTNMTTGNTVNITNSFADITNAMVSTPSTPPAFVGGIIGYPQVSDGTNNISNSYAVMTASSSIPSTVTVGGLLGKCDSNVVSSYCFSKVAHVSGTATVSPFCGSYVAGTMTTNRWSIASSCNGAGCTEPSGMTSAPDGNLQPSTVSTSIPFGDGTTATWLSGIWTFAASSFPVITGL